MSDWFYRAFEDRYRGARGVIRDRLAVYLPFVAPLAHDGGAAALDLGCGRGEWLELLGESGFMAEGIDLDEGMLAACRERGLRAVQGDALDVLRATRDASVAVVSAFHLVEHIEFARVQTLIAEALRVLQPGGLLLLETPNPENLVVGTSSFYDDPSHLRPLPPKLLAFAAEFGGFARHLILRLQEPRPLGEGGSLTLFDVFTGVSPDYGVVAQKAGSSVQMALQDGPFGKRYGIDLRDIAQTYQQQQDAVPAQLRQLEDQHAADGVRLQQQLAQIDTQVAQLHQTTVLIAADVARSAAAIDHAATAAASSAERLGLLDERLGLLDERLGLMGQRLGPVDQRLDRLDALAQQAHAERQARLRAEESAAALRHRVSELAQMHRLAHDEAGRLAAHVAWIESRLTQAEANGAAMRDQLSARQRSSVRALVGRLFDRGRRGAREPHSALLQRVVRLVLRRPALKRAARAVLTRFPRLHTRLLQLMYAPAHNDNAASPDVDPLSATMSPRSLAIYRALSTASTDREH